MALEAQPPRSFLLLLLKPATLLRRLGKPREPQRPVQPGLWRLLRPYSHSYRDARTDHRGHYNDCADPDSTFDDDQVGTAVFATIITLEGSSTILTRELDILDGIDYFAISNTEPGKTWLLTPEYLSPETSSG